MCIQYNYGTQYRSRTNLFITHHQVQENLSLLCLPHTAINWTRPILHRPKSLHTATNYHSHQLDTSHSTQAQEPTYSYQLPQPSIGHVPFYTGARAYIRLLIITAINWTRPILHRPKSLHTATNYHSQQLDTSHSTQAQEPIYGY